MKLKLKPYAFPIWQNHLFFSSLLIAILVSQSNANALRNRNGANASAVRLSADGVGLEAEKDNDIAFYPLADDDQRSNGSSGEKASLRYRVNGERKDHNMQVLVDAIRQILAQLGFNILELRQALSTNQSLFEKEQSWTNRSEEIEKLSGGLSMPEYEERMMAILRRRNEDEDKIKEKIQGLLRENYQNRTLLIKMIQLVASKWGKSASELPQPFGSLNSTGPLHYPPELRQELRDLTPLLTKDLQHDLQTLLGRDPATNRTERVIKETEVATVEEDTDGNRIVRISRNTAGSKPHIQVFSDGKLLRPVFRTHAKEGDEDEYTIFEGSVSESKGGKEDNPDISPAHLESLIRREQQQRKARRFMDVASFDIKHRNRMTRANATKANSRKKRL